MFFCKTFFLARPVVLWFVSLVLFGSLTTFSAAVGSRASADGSLSAGRLRALVIPESLMSLRALLSEKEDISAAGRSAACSKPLKGTLQVYTTSSDSSGLSLDAPGCDHTKRRHFNRQESIERADGGTRARGAGTFLSCFLTDGLPSEQPASSSDELQSGEHLSASWSL